MMIKDWITAHKEHSVIERVVKLLEEQGLEMVKLQSDMLNELKQLIQQKNKLKLQQEVLYR